VKTINTYCIIWHTQQGWTTWKFTATSRLQYESLSDKTYWRC